jgi:hypothetical protein
MVLHVATNGRHIFVLPFFFFFWLIILVLSFIAYQNERTIAKRGTHATLIVFSVFNLYPSIR